MSCGLCVCLLMREQYICIGPPWCTIITAAHQYDMTHRLVRPTPTTQTTILHSVARSQRTKVSMVHNKTEMICLVIDDMMMMATRCLRFVPSPLLLTAVNNTMHNESMQQAAVCAFICRKALRRELVSRASHTILYQCSSYTAKRTVAWGRSVNIQRRFSGENYLCRRKKIALNCANKIMCTLTRTRVSLHRRRRRREESMHSRAWAALWLASTR